MVKTKLEMGFKDELDKIFKISLDNPKEGIAVETIKNTMDTIVEKDVFRNKEKKLVAKDSAKIITTETREISLA